MTKKLKDSSTISFSIVTGVATVFTILGYSIKDMFPLECVNPPFLAVIIRVFIVLIFYAVTFGIIYFLKYLKYKDRINLKVRKNNITIKSGNIFKEDAWRVIAMDTHFDTTVDDVVISKTSLHGQLVLEHGDPDSINAVVKKEADRRGISPDENKKYTFPLGTAIPYKGKDGCYIMVALTELNTDFESHTKMAEYENTLMKIWRELNRVYAKYDLALPVLGSGITRFDDAQDDPEDLLRCMLCTLNTSKTHFKSSIRIVLYRSEDDQNQTQKMKHTKKNPEKSEMLQLYEYKDLFRIIR